MKMNKSESFNSLDLDCLSVGSDEEELNNSSRKVQVLRMKPACKAGYQSDSSISWIWKTADESDSDNDSIINDVDEDNSITESPLTDAKLRQKSSDWDMSIINGHASEDEIYVSSNKSLNKPSSRVDMKEKMNRSNSSLLSLELLSLAEEDELMDTEDSKHKSFMGKSGLSLATAFDDEEPTGLRFNPKLDVHEYIARDEYTEEEYFQCFYTPMEASVMLASRNKMIDKINSGKMKNQDSARGLEYWVQNTSEHIDRRVDSMISKVMDEQDLQIETGTNNPMKLAEMSLSVSIESMAVALKIAMRDAKVARKAYRQMFEKEQETIKDLLPDMPMMLPESLAEKSSKHRRRKSKTDGDSVSGRSTRSASTRKSKSKSNKKGDEENNNNDKEPKKPKRRSSDFSKNLKKQESERAMSSSDKRSLLKKQESEPVMGSSNKRNSLKKQSSERSVGSTETGKSKKSTSSKSKKTKKKDKTAKETGTILEDVKEDGEVTCPESPTKMKKRKSDESKKKRRSSAADIKVKEKKEDKKAAKRSSGSSETKKRDEAKRRSSSPAALLVKQLKRRSSSSSKPTKERSEELTDPTCPASSSLSSGEDECLDNSTKSPTKSPSTTARRSFLTTDAYREMGTSWLQFLKARGDIPTLAALDDT